MAKIEDIFKYEFKGDKKIILLTGKPRIGKSTTINAFLQKELAFSDSGLLSTTIDASFYETKDFIFIDTPGLFAEDLSEGKYFQTLNKIRHVKFIDAVLLVCANALTPEDMVSSNWLKYALCSPFTEIKTNIIFTKVMADDDEEFEEQMKRYKHDSKQFKVDGGVFGLRTINTQNRQKIITGLLKDSQLKEIICLNSPIIRNNIGMVMEERSLALSKVWLGDEKSITETIMQIERKSKWMVKLLDSVVAKIKEEIKKAEFRDIQLIGEIGTVTAAVKKVVNSGAATMLAETIMPGIMKVGLITIESIDYLSMVVNLRILKCGLN